MTTVDWEVLLLVGTVEIDSGWPLAGTSVRGHAALLTALILLPRRSFMILSAVTLSVTDPSQSLSLYSYLLNKLPTTILLACLLACMSHGSSCCSRLSTFPVNHIILSLYYFPPPLVFVSDFETYLQSDSFFLFFLLFPSCKPRSCSLSVHRLLPRLDLHDILHLPKLVYVYQHCINSLGHTSTSTPL
ncbi:hypothetical protein BO99DRAFT_19882 [Aspergillus violaceofuscus CBS 115571]|uniref:Uncharacterized protein n=1 Tax=Aspergillus violaceofuscus (strain CBS 115571) TaxID=1450538 RepID=A0A2V5HF27_ASPV1|nr:hypothetical protein BO99DRAFT_19882 [Aspergillus violaceofuscus CBS 115571]